MNEETLNAQMICNRVYVLIDGLLCEMERVCEIHEDEEDEEIH